MSTKKIFLILTILGVLLFNAADFNYYPQISQGDHGRDLYAAQEILRGKLPYKDFWWVYGPLMPYYYALFYKITGGTVVSFLIGKIILEAVCAAFFYLAASTLMAPFIAFIAALWFAGLQQDFFFTFNHIGGIAMQLGILFLLFSYIQNQRTRLAWLALPAIFCYCLIKINFGLASLAAVLMTIGLTDFINKNPLADDKKKFYLTSLVFLPFLVFITYWILLKDLPMYAIRQCMPYFGDDQPHHFPPSMTIPYYFTQHWLTFTHALSAFQDISQRIAQAPLLFKFINIAGVTLNLLIQLLLHSATIAVIALLALKKITGEEKKRLFLAVSCLGIFFVLNFHEFLVSGVWYRTFWSLPFLFMFHFVMTATAFGRLPVIARGLIWACFILSITLSGVIQFFSTQQQKIPDRFINSPHGQIFTGNEPQWVETVNAVTSYLAKSIKEDEQIFALPYDDIYYYLLGKESPTRQLIFFDHIKIPPQQEASIIGELESRKVAYVLLSNRYISSETGLGVFGQTYCRLIAQYLHDKYAPVERLGGNWQAEPGWGNNHGVLILKKK